MASSETVSRAEALAARTKTFAVRVVVLCRRLPYEDASRVVGRQLLRSATGTAANYRAAVRSRSRREFAARVGVALEEADESVFWLDILADVGLARSEEVEPLRDEARQLTAIFSASRRTAQARLRSEKQQSTALCRVQSLNR